jgi:hypothetical protein
MYPIAELLELRNCWIGCVPRPVVGFASCSRDLPPCLERLQVGVSNPHATKLPLRTRLLPGLSRPGTRRTNIPSAYNGGFSIEKSGVVLRCAPDSGIHLPATPVVTCWAIGIRLSPYRLSEMSFRWDSDRAWFVACYLKCRPYRIQFAVYSWFAI